MFIAIHVHTLTIPGMPRYGKPAYATPKQLIERYDKLGIERAILLPEVSPECAYVSQSNEEIIELSRQNSRFIPFYNIDPRALTNSAEAPLGDILSYYKDQGCKGIGEVTANLYGDLSAGSGCNALARDENYAIKFLNEFQDRLMFGTDICAPDTPTPLVDFMLKLKNENKISATVFNKVARENAIRILDL